MSVCSLDQLRLNGRGVRSKCEHARKPANRASLARGYMEIPMLNRKLVAEAARELGKPLDFSEAGEKRTAAYFVASSLRLEGIASTPESVLRAAEAVRRRRAKPPR